MSILQFHGMQVKNGTILVTHGSQNCSDFETQSHVHRHEAVERTRVQTALFYEMIFVNINKLSSYDVLLLSIFYFCRCIVRMLYCKRL